MNTKTKKKPYKFRCFTFSYVVRVLSGVNMKYIGRIKQVINNEGQHVYQYFPKGKKIGTVAGPTIKDCIEKLTK